jgi:hypothetical protein
MANDPYTIRIFVEEGDPEGVRLIDQMNWTGRGVVFPREKWAAIRQRREFEEPGVYVLIGLPPSDNEKDELPTIYIGEGDGVRDRIDNHAKNKEFWSWGVLFHSTNRGLNKAHVQWLEFALVKQAREANRSHLDNGNAPLEPALNPGEKAETRRFLKEILQILPLAGLRAFDIPKATVPAGVKLQGADSALQLTTGNDTIVVPAQEDGFEEVFLGEDCWYSIRISGGMIPKIKWIAAYQTKPVSAITYLAKVARIEPYGEGGKYKLVFDGKAQKITPIPLGQAPRGTMQGPRYTTKDKLLKAKKVMDAFEGT